MFNFRIESWTMGSWEIHANYFVWQVVQHGYHGMSSLWKSEIVPKHFQCYYL